MHMCTMQKIISHLSEIEFRARNRPYTTVEDYTNALDDACLLIGRLTAYSIRVDVSTSSPVRCLRRAKAIGDIEIMVTLDIASHIHTSCTVRLIQDTMVLTKVEMWTVSGKIWILPTHVAGPSLTWMVPISSDGVNIKMHGDTSYNTTRHIEDAFHSFIKNMFRLELVPLTSDDEFDHDKDSDTDLDEDLDADLDTDIDSVSWNSTSHDDDTDDATDDIIDDATSEESFEYRTPSPPPKKSRTECPPPVRKRYPKRYIIRYGFM